MYLRFLETRVHFIVLIYRMIYCELLTEIVFVYAAKRTKRNEKKKKTKTEKSQFLHERKFHSKITIMNVAGH